MYGINAKVPFGEDDPIHQPIFLPYAATKAAGELLVTRTHISTASGASVCDSLRFMGRASALIRINRFARLISEDKPIPVFGDGTTRRDYTFIDDIIAGVRAAIDFDKTITK